MGTHIGPSIAATRRPRSRPPTPPWRAYVEYELMKMSMANAAPTPASSQLMALSARREASR
jgi:hypothetical protein